MGLRKCPRCELNYILDDGELCTVCREEVRGKRAKDDSITMCSACGEFPTLPGEDMCRACLAELRSIDILSTDSDDEGDVEGAELDPDPVSSLDEIEAVDGLDADEVPEDEEKMSDEELSAI